jgi:2-C-methyl-D-erythritol 2,4-cyclodiphosphate synthase
MGRKLILGGVEIVHSHGLDGHSDADVLIHAICDALLGAAGKGDIGEHFPNTDPRYKGIASSVLLKKVNDVLINDGYSICNVDVVVQAEEPKLKDYKDKMRFHIAFTLALDEDAVNIKATTQEGLGAIGHKEGIAAFATVMISKES